MISIDEQIKKGYLVCPKSHMKLIWKNESKKELITPDGKYSYPVLNEVIPLLLFDPQLIKDSLNKSDMVEKYSKKPNKYEKYINGIRKFFSNDVRTINCANAMKIFDNIGDESIGLSIGGGPVRHHQKLLNLNICPFENVDIVADAHHLPYADNCVEVIHCEAILEHLYNPWLAVKEMYRVTKKDGMVYSCTPFLQLYHGCPYHYQNFTLTGHINLFESSSFYIKESGVCVGPTFALSMFIRKYIELYFPIWVKPLNELISVLNFGIIKHIDKKLNYTPNAHLMASATYLIAIKK